MLNKKYSRIRLLNYVEKTQRLFKISVFKFNLTETLNTLLVFNLGLISFMVVLKTFRIFPRFSNWATDFLKKYFACNLLHREWASVITC